MPAKQIRACDSQTSDVKRSDSTKSKIYRPMGKLDLKKDTDVESAKKRGPPDGGWGWMVVIGGVLVHMLVGGYSRVYSLIFEHMRTKYGSSATLTATVGGLFVSMRFLLSPVFNNLAARFGTRKVVFIGAILLGSGCTLNAFATSTEFMLFSYSLLAGCGAAMVYGPSLVLIASYFSSRRGVALGLTTSGSSVGAFFLIQMNIRLFESIGFRSALLVTGAIMFGCIISAILYRPLDSNNDDLDEDLNSYSSESSIEKVPDSSDFDSSDKEGDEEDSDEPDQLVKKSGQLSQVVFVGGAADDDDEIKESRCSRIASSLNMSAWMAPEFALYTLATSWCVLCAGTVTLLIVSVEMELGTSERQAATLLSILSVSDTAGRILSGFFFDWRFISCRRQIPYCVSALMMGATLVCWPVVTTYQYRLAMSLAFGLFNGTLVAQQTNVLCDLVGVQRLSTSHGSMAGFHGICSMMGPPVFGMLRDTFGTYRYVMYALGVGACVAGVLVAAAFVYVASSSDEEKRATGAKSKSKR